MNGATRREAVERARRSGRVAVLAILVTVVVHAAAVFARAPAGLWADPGAPAASFEVVRVVNEVTTLTWDVAMVLFLVWLHRALANTAVLGAPSRFRGWKAVVLFFIPIVWFVGPYLVMRDLLLRSDPGPLPDAPVYRARDVADYRGGEREAVAPPTWAYPAPLLAWWGLFVLRLFGAPWLPVFVVSRAVDAAVSCLSDAAAAVACAMVIRAVGARQRERLRRLEALE